MTILQSKGTRLGIGLANSIVNLAQVLSIDYSGLKSNTFAATTLDGAVYEKKLQTGYSSPGQIAAELFFDPAVRASLTGYVDTPAEFRARITFADDPPTAWVFKAAGIELGVKVAMEDGVKSSVTIELSEAPTWA